MSKSFINNAIMSASLCRRFQHHCTLTQTLTNFTATQCAIQHHSHNAFILQHNNTSIVQYNHTYNSQQHASMSTLLPRQRPGHNPLRMRGRGPPPMKPNQKRSPVALETIRAKQLEQYNNEFKDRTPLSQPVVPTQYNNRTIDIVSLQSGTVTDTYKLNNNVWQQPLRLDIVQRVVEWQRAKARAGLANTKSRADVSGTGRKPHPQKGTGRARQGTRRGPHHTGGGSAHGPHPRSFEFALNKKVRRLGMRVVLSNLLNNSNVYIIDNTLIESYKTKTLLDIIQKHQWADKRILLCYSESEPIDNNLLLAGRNLGNKIDFIAQVGLNVLSMLRHNVLVLTKQAVVELEQRLDEQQRLPSYERDAIDNIAYHESLKTYKWAKETQASENDVNEVEDDTVPNKQTIAI